MGNAMHGGVSGEFLDMKKKLISEDGLPLVTRETRKTTSISHRMDVLDGSIIIGHRPGIRAIKALGRKGVTHLVTLMSESEGATSIGEAVREENIRWIWFSMKTGNPLGKKRIPELKRLFIEIADALNSGGMVYVHCSAGIHRTGMIVYAFLRRSGFPENQAHDMLNALRLVTAESVGEERLAWGDRLAESMSKEDI